VQGSTTAKHPHVAVASTSVHSFLAFAFFSLSHLYIHHKIQRKQNRIWRYDRHQDNRHDPFFCLCINS
jgi:hypothetical protein